MTLSQLKLCYSTTFSLKKKLICILVMCCMLHVNAQDANNVKLRIEPGLILLSGSNNAGFLINIEPHIKISDNKVIGLKFGVAFNTQKFKDIDNSQFIIGDQDDNAVISFVSTFDYYLNDDKNRPYIGVGLGYYLFNYTDVFRRNGSATLLEGRVNAQPGLLLRGGFEIGNTRLSLEYNLVPKAAIKIPDGQIIGAVNNSYFGLSIGFTIGAGRRS